MKAQRNLVSFIGIGSRSAAPLLYSYINLHPDLCTIENSKFFSQTKVYALGIDWYEGLFAKYDKGLIYGELAFNYLKNPTSVSLISRTYPGAKLVAVIESPLVSVRAAYIEARRARAISPETSLAMFLKQNPEVLMDAKYGRQLGQYFNYYSHKDLLVVTTDDVENDTLATLAKVYEHIGVNKNYVPLLLQHLVPAEDGPVVKKPGLIKRFFRLIKRSVANVYRFIMSKIITVKVPIETVSEVAKRVSLSPELEEYLKNYYRQDVEVLSNALHRNMSIEWGFEADNGAL